MRTAVEQDKIRYRGYIIAELHWNDRNGHPMSKYFVLDRKKKMIWQGYTLTGAKAWIEQRTP